MYLLVSFYFFFFRFQAFSWMVGLLAVFLLLFGLALALSSKAFCHLFFCFTLVFSQASSFLFRYCSFWLFFVPFFFHTHSHMRALGAHRIFQIIYTNNMVHFSSFFFVFFISKCAPFFIWFDVSLPLQTNIGMINVNVYYYTNNMEIR